MTEDDAELLADVRKTLRREEYYDTAVIGFLLRLLDEERAARQWRPIDDAARSGGPIWAWGPHIGTDLLEWDEKSSFEFMGNPCHWHSDRELAYIQDLAVTMYTLLPEPPV